MDFPLPQVTPLTESYWDALRRGRIAFQACRCGHRWLPAREACPRCLGTDHAWQDGSGRAEVVSWVVYHTAHHDAFKDRVPYNVAIVALEEGPRLITNILAPHDTLRPGMKVVLKVEEEAGFALARFAPADG
jgi:hypothetical protein